MYIGMCPAPLLQLSASMVLPPSFRMNYAQKKNIAEKGLSVRTTCFADTINVHAGRRFVNGKKWNFVGGTASGKPAERMEHILPHSLGRFS